MKRSRVNAEGLFLQRFDIRDTALLSPQFLLFDHAMTSQKAKL
jgi:hypothetical protein